MSNQPDCRPPYSESDHILRQTFTWRFRDPADAAAFARLGERLQEWIYETNQFGPERDRERRGSVLEAELAAAGVDLLRIARYLEERSRERFEFALDENEARSAERAESWAAEARALGERILADSAPAN